MAQATQVKGYKETMRSLNKMEKETKKAVRDGLKKAGEPIRVRAEQRALGEISNIGPAWSRIKLGVKVDSIYLAPGSRAKGGSSRPNLGGLLIARAMYPAVKDEYSDMLETIEESFWRLAREAGF